MMVGGKLSGRVRLGIAIAVLTSLSVATPAASGAVYEVHACRLPNGDPAPALGWKALAGSVASINCPGGRMAVRVPAGTTAFGGEYGLSFRAPSGTTLTGLSRRAEGQLVSTATFTWAYQEAGTPADGAPVFPMATASGTGPIDMTYQYPFRKRLFALHLLLKCGDGSNGGPCQQTDSYFGIPQVAVKIDDSTPPRVLSASGSLLATNGPLKGEKHLAMKLSDVGSGLFRVAVEVDGDRMDARPIDDNQGGCRMPFVVPVPCKLTASVDVPIDTTRLTEGTHAITVRVLDATGVNAAVVGPVTILVDNLPDPPPRGTAACPTRSAATVRRKLKSHIVHYGRTALITGRIVGSKSLLKGAHVGVVDNPAIAAGSRLVRVRNHGRFRIKVRPRQSTQLRPILVSANGLAQACGKSVKVAVRAGVRLRTTPRHLRNGQSIRMRGRVADVRLPKQGKTVAIQARARGAGSWTTVTLMRTDASGYFDFAYRFRKTFQTTTYEFRTVVPRERGYPFRRGWSRIRRATVSP